MATKKRWRTIQPKPGHIVARWGKPDRWNSPDLCYAWGSRAQKPDGRVLMRALEEAEVFEGRSLREELELRGYDLTTLRFSIALATETPDQNPTDALHIAGADHG